ncbi:MAG: class I poly(R)-hydroxyalkanoic acid synthase, partial [Erythrobacter sp.]
MADHDQTPDPGSNAVEAFFDMQGEAMRELFAGAFAGASGDTGQDRSVAALFAQASDADELADWAKASSELQRMWLDFAAHQAREAGEKIGGGANPMDPAQWMVVSQSMLAQMPKGLFEAQGKLAEETMQLWQGMTASFMGGLTASGPVGDAERKLDLPRSDRRFADPAWREHPAFALLHQTYLMLADYFKGSVRAMEGIDGEKRRQLEFAVNALAEAMSPGNFLLTNPVVMKRTIETRGQNLVRGMQHLINDLKRGQLTHTDPDAFTLGENLAATPGKVVHETPLYQLIQYSPTTEEVYEVPLVVFPPWINRFYILDLTPKKSFIKWAVDQGITMFVVSWKSADESLADTVWDDYIRAQIEAIDLIRERLKVPHVHTIGYCVAGTTLAATLAILARRDEADRVKSATYFTAQVDFEKSG